jgi:hypothetical protein
MPFNEWYSGPNQLQALHAVGYKGAGTRLRSLFVLWELHRDALGDSVCYFEHKCTTQHTTAELSRSFLRGMSWKQRATTSCLRGRTGTSSWPSQKERYMRALERRERFSSEADSETVFLFAEDVKEAHSEFLMALEAVFRG